MLLETGDIDVNQSMYNGTTPLYWASQEGHVNVVKELLKQPGIDINKAEINNGVTPLHIACQRGYLEVVQMLIDAGANLNQGKKDGTTPVDTASEYGHTEIVNLLKTRIKMDVAKLFFKMHKRNDKKYVPPGVQGHIAGFLTGKYHQYVVDIH